MTGKFMTGKTRGLGEHILTCGVTCDVADEIGRRGARRDVVAGNKLNGKNCFSHTQKIKPMT